MKGNSLLTRNNKIFFLCLFGFLFFNCFSQLHFRNKTNSESIKKNRLETDKEIINKKNNDDKKKFNGDIGTEGTENDIFENLDEKISTIEKKLQKKYFSKKPEIPLYSIQEKWQSKIPISNIIDIDGDGNNEIISINTCYSDKRDTTVISVFRWGERIYEFLWRSPGFDNLVDYAFADIDRNGKVELVILKENMPLEILTWDKKNMEYIGNVAWDDMNIRYTGDIIEMPVDGVYSISIGDIMNDEKPEIILVSLEKGKPGNMREVTSGVFVCNYEMGDIDIVWSWKINSFHTPLEVKLINIDETIKKEIQFIIQNYDTCSSVVISIGFEKKTYSIQGLSHSANNALELFFYDVDDDGKIEMLSNGDGLPRKKEGSLVALEKRKNNYHVVAEIITKGPSGQKWFEPIILSGDADNDGKCELIFACNELSIAYKPELIKENPE